jgi:membrane-bound serine protease (ClpP class)
MDTPILGYLLVAAGLVLMAAELFLPTEGILFVIGVGGLIGGVAMTFAYDRTQGLVTLIALFIFLPIAGPLVLHYWPRTTVGRKLVLSSPEDDATVAQMPVNLELEALRGRYGKTLSPLRPSGVTDFDGQRVDTLSEGPLIEAGKWVRCIEVRAGRVVVREVAGPPDLSAINPEDFKV